MNLFKKAGVAFCFCLVGHFVCAQDCAQDSIPPELVCGAGFANLHLSKNTPQFGLGIADFINSVSDNCSLEDDILMSFDSSESKKTLIISCENLGQNNISIYATDKAGNQSVCHFSFIISDATFVCNDPVDFEIIGTYLNEPFGLDPLYTIKLVDTNGVDSLLSPIETFITDEEFGINLFDGEVPFPQSSKISIDITDQSSDYDNGVSTLDVVFIIKHILGISPFTKPEQLIAADVNGDGKVTAMDVIEIRKLIIGLTKEFPIKKSRIVLPANWEIDVSQLDKVRREFKVIKVGDVNTL